MLWNLRPHGITGSKIEKLLDFCHITANKNSIVGDKSAITPGGVRLGTPALTTRGLTEKNFEDVAEFLTRAVDIGKHIQAASPSTKLVDFVKACEQSTELSSLGAEVREYAVQFPFPGLESPFPTKL
mmetsp:Transcript_14894/g.17119  ORF Transcript_14894/g.17119 Transcript_14894/m.17119 type:complete len:127 (+) Transcript_14894:1-381(+)